MSVMCTKWWDGSMRVSWMMMECARFWYSNFAFSIWRLSNVKLAVMMMMVSISSRLVMSSLCGSVCSSAFLKDLEYYIWCCVLNQLTTRKQEAFAGRTRGVISGFKGFAKVVAVCTNNIDRRMICMCWYCTRNSYGKNWIPGLWKCKTFSFHRS